ncbi:MAG: internal scaffolding protein [Microvirus sp.]|nr:MAG: internal scaffolding protein [Microvirus sp.]
MEETQVKRRFNWRHQYDVERDELEGNACLLYNEEPSLTQQQFAEDTDINVLARRFGLDKTNVMPPAPIDPRAYGDMTDAPDLREALDMVNTAKNRFMALPPKLRARFHNEPSELWEFVTDPENADESVRLGLLARAPNPTTTTTSAQPEAVKKDTPLQDVSSST